VKKHFIKISVSSDKEVAEKFPQSDFSNLAALTLQQRQSKNAGLGTAVLHIRKDSSGGTH